MNIDDTLLQECAKGSERAYYKLYSISFSCLMSVCVRYFKNQEDANAALNKAFLRIVQNVSQYKKEVPWEHWIRKIMVNTIINEFRSNKKRKEMFSTHDYSDSAIFDSMGYNDIVENIDVEHIKSLIHQLPEIQNQVFNLYAIDGYSHKEISDVLDIPVGTSKWILSQARTQLKTLVVASMNLRKEIAS